MAKLFLALGSNLGARQDNLHRAISLIEERVGRVVAVSKFYATEPDGFSSSNTFLNATIEVKTRLRVYRVLRVTQEIERIMGRKEKSVGGVHSDRVIDIDILLYSNYRTKRGRLQVPHPRMLQRDFVMIPLRDIMSDSAIRNIKI